MAGRDRIQRGASRPVIVENPAPDVTVDPSACRRVRHGRLHALQDLVQRGILLDDRGAFQVDAGRLRANVHVRVVDARNTAALQRSTWSPNRFSVRCSPPCC
jgi:hypothetical protein